MSVYAYACGNPISLRDPLGLWGFGDPIPEPLFNYSVGVADGFTAGLGRYIRSFTRYADEVSTCSIAYKAGLVTGVAAQAGIGTGAVAAAGGVQSEAIEALYTAGEAEGESAIEAAQKAIEAASTLRSTTPAVW